MGLVPAEHRLGTVLAPRAHAHAHVRAPCEHVRTGGGMEDRTSALRPCTVCASMAAAALVS